LPWVGTPRSVAWPQHIEIERVTPVSLCAARCQGLTLSIEPHWGFADDTGGAPADQQRAEFRLLADRELIPGRFALNIDYEPVQTWLRGSGESLRDSTFGIGAALAMRVMPNVFFGAEARNPHHYEGLGLDSLAGQALYIGPTLYATFSQGYFVSAAWNVQVWGRWPPARAYSISLISRGTK
jgi:hypothetical protein